MNLVTKHRVVAAVVVFAALVVSPVGVYHVVTSSEDEVRATSLTAPDEPSRAQEEKWAAERAERRAMLAAARKLTLGTWEYTIGSTKVRFRLVESKSDTRASIRRESSIIGAAYACGSHSLVAEAGACIDLYYLPVDVEMITGAFTKPTATVSMVSAAAMMLSVTFDDRAGFSATLTDTTIRVDPEYRERPRAQSLRRIELDQPK